MNFNNIGAPVAGGAGVVDQFLGQAYPKVRLVAEKMQLIQTLVPLLSKVEIVSLNIAEIRDIAKHVSLFPDMYNRFNLIDQQMGTATQLLNQANQMIGAATTAAGRAELAANTATTMVGTVNKALLVYPDLETAQLAAQKLPDQQTVVVENQEKSYKILGGELSSPTSIGLGGIDPLAFYNLAKS